MKLKYIYYIILFSTFINVSKSVAQFVGPMPIRCVTVEKDGNVTLKFSSPVISAGAGYEDLKLYYSDTKSGPYNFVLIPNSNSLSTMLKNGAKIILPTNNANTQVYYFYTQVVYNDGVSFNLLSGSSDTLSTIYLQTTISTDGISNLNWSSFSTLSSSNQYRIHRWFYEYNRPLYDTLPIDSTSAQQFDENLIGKCDDDVNYRVEVWDYVGQCFSSSNTVKNAFTTPGPAAPIIKFATKNILNLNVIEWEPSVTSLTSGYRIYKLLCTGPFKVKSTIGNTTFYTDYDTTSGCAKCTEYRVASYISCPSYLVQKTRDTVKVGDTSPYHNAITVTHKFNPCTYRVNLSWCPYKNWKNGVKSYKVLCSKNEEKFNTVATLDSTKNTYTYIAGKEVATYIFQIVAISNVDGYISESNLDTLYAAVPKQPKEIFTKSATVLANGYVKGFFTNDTLASVKRYDIYRSETENGDFTELVDSVPFNKHKILLSFTDTTALTNEQSYYYRIETIDSCGNVTTKSNISKTILLGVETQLNMSNLLNYNLYQGWPSGVNYYEINRSYTNRFEEEIVGKQPVDSGLFYVDDVSDSLNPTGFFCYRVMAVSIYDTIHYDVDSSYSNIVCVQQAQRIFVPNAFTPPDGYNPVFKPLINFIPTENYELKIFDRWGKLLITINDLDKGWDGTYNNNPCPIGVYSWQIRYKNVKKEFKYLKGTVSLIR